MIESVSNSGPFIFPLRDVADIQLEQLAGALWNWQFCSVCTYAQPCASANCFRRRFTRLKPFFDWYKGLTDSYIPEDLHAGADQAIRHEDVFEIIRLTKKRPDVPRSQLTVDYFSRRKDKTPSINDQHRAFNLAMRVSTMVHCCFEGQSGYLLETGQDASIWRSSISATDFMTSNFPIKDHPSLSEESESSAQIKIQLAAVNLKKIARLSFVGTNDLRNHLKFDRKSGVVEIFHHTGFIKECLLASQKGYLTVVPDQLLLEILDSFQKILFPIDSKSQALLRNLVSTEAFDPDCLRFGPIEYKRVNENEIVYKYLGSHLMDLYDEIENPTPRGYIDTWLEKKSKARHVMLATLAGVVIAIILGILGLAVGIFQSWVSYQAWKHPVNNTRR